MRLLRNVVGVGILVAMAMYSVGARGAVISVDRVIRVGDLQYNRIEAVPQGGGEAMYTDVLSTTEASQKSIVAKGGDTVQFTLTLDSPMWLEFSQMSASMGATFQMRNIVPPKGPETSLTDAEPAKWIDGKYMDLRAPSAKLYLEKDPGGGREAQHSSAYSVPPWSTIPMPVVPGAARGFTGSFTLPADFPETQFGAFYWEVTASAIGPASPDLLVRVAVPEPAGLGGAAGMVCLLMRRSRRGCRG